MEQHKVFISFYHQDDQYYKNYLINQYQYNIVDKSVSNGEYDSDNSDEYVKRLIRDEKNKRFFCNSSALWFKYV